LPSHQLLREPLRLVPIGLGLFGAVYAIEPDLDLFVSLIQDRDGIAIGDVNDFGVEVRSGDVGSWVFGFSCRPVCQMRVKLTIPSRGL